MAGPVSRVASALLVASLLSPLPAVASEQVSGRYDIMIGGLQVGVAGFEGRISNEAYETSVSVRLSGVSRLVASGRGSAMAQGRISGARAIPASYRLDLTTTQVSDTIRMGMSGGSIRSLTAEPARPLAADAVPVTSAHHQNILDPLAAALFIAPGANVMAPDTCAKSFPVFDGRQRYDLGFSFSRVEDIRVPGYAGPALVCQARYKPIAGHRPAQTEAMEANRDMRIWLAPVAGTRVLVPARIAIRTPVGMAEIVPTRLELGAPAATATVRR